ncbi:TPA: hypothetical protein EYN98_09500 [Candidatus Poribacteria bacterium]|nr:hypothetical protein [Candidatus Poribacteria bacterium]HIB91549.1 hypothetical protein [Candidatus Poribacteria bacterium]HIC01973.1 hypothetical protein [Candidatus Poribacteria bacterium]HIC19700.1 hypothetical protein [Candidatus Poribacteria bacterium]HIM09990.1 hypothetical protein [Candidatus Poribacteria bacterium]
MLWTTELLTIYNGKKKGHTLQAQVVINQQTLQIIIIVFSCGRKRDFQLFKDSQIAINSQIRCLVDSGYQSLTKFACQ